LSALGFASYILTAIFSLLAFREPMWMRVPEMPDEDPQDSIRFFYSGKGEYNLEKIAMQLSLATELHQETNNRKYAYLRMGLAFLMIGIIMTAIGGFTLLATLR
jgi:hypothetical protein